MKFLNTARSLPLSTRRALVTVIVAVLAVIGVSLWVSFDFGLPKKDGGLQAISEGAGSVAQLIQDQTDKYSQQKEQLEQNLQQTLKSSALVLPDSLADVQEEPDGVLFLQYQYRENSTQTTLKDITFYPSYTLMKLSISNENSEPIYIDVGRGSVIEQQSGSTTIDAQPIYQTGSPAEIAPNESADVQIVFSPINGRLPFSVVVGDYAAKTQTADKPSSWSAHFEVDPNSIVDQENQS